MADGTNATPTAASADPRPEPTERELIEAAARAAPADQGTTTDRAKNIIQAAAIQRKAVNDAYETQKKAINEGVKKQRTAAMKQMAQARDRFTADEAQKKIREARAAATTLVTPPAGKPTMKKDTPHDLPPAPADPAPARPAMSADVAPAGAAQAPAPQPPAAQTARPAYDPALSPEAPIANELARTIREIIAHEIDAQLKALLAVHTAPAIKPDER